MMSAVSPSMAVAQSSDMHLDIEVGTDLPISVGGTASLQVPYGIRVSTGLGTLPAGYVTIINEVVTSLDGYNDATADLVEQTLQNSLVWRTHIGWIADFGLYIDAGYTLATLGGGSSVEEIIVGIVGREPPSRGAEREYDIESTLHMLDVEIGWKGVFWDAFVVRAALGFSGTIASKTTVQQRFSVNGPVVQRGIDEFEGFVEKYLDDTYQTYVFTPVFTVSLGYRIF
jgi:hypothetical protein